MVFSLLLVAAFLLPWWRSYLGLTLDGYFPLYGHLLLEGKIPYRDFFLHLPPLHALFDALIEYCFGKSLLALRIAGAAERLLMAGVLVFWLSRHFRLASALYGGVAAVILASCDDTEILDLYNHHALFAAVLSGLALSYGLEEKEGRRPAFYLAGFFAALSFWTKQTIGLNATFAVFLVPLVLAWRSPEARRALPGRLGRITLGWLPPLFLLGGWLLRHGAFEAFLRQVFLDAGASKGPVFQLLTRPWLDPLGNPELQLPVAIAIGVLVLLFAGAGLPSTSGEAGQRSEWPALLAAAAALALLLAASHLILHPVAERQFDLRSLQRIGVFVVTYGILWPAAQLFFRALRRPLEAREAQLLALVVVSGGASSALGFSWPAGEALVYPGLAVLVALALEGRPRFRGARWLKAPLLVALTLSLLTAATFKLIVPFDFAMWREASPEDGTETSASPALAGIRLSATTKEAVDGSLEWIAKASRPGEPIFAFPDLPIFYWLADRPFPTFAALSWFDVTPDHIVDADIPRVEAALPPVIVVHQIPQDVLRLHEIYFRGAKKSALRRMMAKVDELGANYVVAAYYERWRDYPPLQVWVRQDRAAELGIED